jgi:hypothetical protein
MDAHIELLLRHSVKTNRTRLLPPPVGEKRAARFSLFSLGAGVTPAARRAGDLILPI